MRRFDILNISLSPEVICKFNAVPTRTPNILYRIYIYIFLQNNWGNVKYENIQENLEKRMVIVGQLTLKCIKN